MDSLQYYKIPTVAAAYPRPTVSMLPVFNPKSLSLKGQPQSVFSGQAALRVSSGRVAILHALQCIGVTAQDTVLVPAYHCMSMIEPVLWIGAKVRFYPVDHNLCPLIDFTAHQALTDVKAVIIPHFFGFMQNISALCAHFNQRGIAVIEDCAHAFFGERDGKKAGESGDYSITSSVKFFPGTEGGMLYSAKRPITGIALTKRSLYQQLKAAKNILEQGRFRNTLVTLSQFTATNEQQVGHAVEVEYCQINKSNLHYLDPQKINLPLSCADSILVNKTDHHWLMQQRRANYQQLVGLLRGIPHATVIFPDLPAGTVPYVLPLLLHKPQVHFSRLKMAGIPLWRWEELIVNDCPVSNAYRLQLVQLPIHQSLTPDELGWIAKQLWLILSDGG